MDKPSFKSLTFWASILVIAATAAQGVLETIGGDVAAKGVPIVAAIIAIVGRFRATGPLTLR